MEELSLQAEILWPAMVVGVLVLATHIPFGREVLRRGIIFVDLAIAQIAAFGVIVAHTIELYDHGKQAHVHIPPTFIAIVAAIVGSLFLYRLRKLEVRVQESIIGILFILAATGILLLLSVDPQGGEQLKETLIGQILWLHPKELLPLFLSYAAILLAWGTLQDKVGEWVFYPLFAITITLSTQVVGVYLVFASLIIPAVATFRHEIPIVKAFVIGVMGYAIGLIASAIFDFPAGAAIVWSLALMAILYYGVSVLLEKINHEST